MSERIDENKSSATEPTGWEVMEEQGRSNLNIGKRFVSLEDGSSVEAPEGVRDAQDYKAYMEEQQARSREKAAELARSQKEAEGKQGVSLTKQNDKLFINLKDGTSIEAPSGVRDLRDYEEYFAEQQARRKENAQSEQSTKKEDGEAEPEKQENGKSETDQQDKTELESEDENKFEDDEEIEGTEDEHKPTTDESQETGNQDASTKIEQIDRLSENLGKNLHVKPQKVKLTRAEKKYAKHKIKSDYRSNNGGRSIPFGLYRKTYKQMIELLSQPNK